LKKIIDQLAQNQNLTKEEFKQLLENRNPENSSYLLEKAKMVRDANFGNEIYLRGLIEFTNYCKNDCFYCGIRRSNANASRYRLTKEEIMSCCENGYGLGFRTFVLQGGEDSGFTHESMVDLVKTIRKQFPDCAITLSIGEKTYEEYLDYYQAGANRYLLRHETANAIHYGKLHPEQLSSENRQECLRNLKKIGYQVGTGIMVGSPYQTIDHLVEDLLFIKELEPEMVGLGPFIPHKDTQFAEFPAGSEEETLYLIGIVRLLLPHALIPATTALGTIDAKGREKGVLAGANVLMPNLSPIGVREKYALYDNKICTGEEAAECNECLRRRMESIGYQVVDKRGDYQK
jgi:biotin synthase